MVALLAGTAGRDDVYLNLCCATLLRLFLGGMGSSRLPPLESIPDGVSHLGGPLRPVTPTGADPRAAVSALPRVHVDGPYERLPARRRWE